MTLPAKKAEGVKHDEGKVRWDLMPWDALEEVAKVLTHGAKTYGDRNWESGMAWNRLIRAGIGHFIAFAAGEDEDMDSRLSPLAHVVCCALFLLAYQKRGLGTDNRAS